jgi:hypothetical protein
MYAEREKKFMFKMKKSTKQIIMTLLPLFVIMLMMQLVATAMKNKNALDAILRWQVFHFENSDYNTQVSYEIEEHSNEIKAVLINESESEIRTGAGFTLIFQDENGGWRIFPFREDFGFNVLEIILPPGYSAVYSLTEDMFSTSLMSGSYRIVTEIWGDDIENTPIWASFDLPER